MNNKHGNLPENLPAEIHDFRKRIDQWRSTRRGRSRMPEELWASATEFARAHGAWSVARALQVNYQGLRRRVEAETKTKIATKPNTSTFVEVDTSQWIDPGKRGSISLEFESAGGAKLSLRLEGDSKLNASALATAFWELNR